MGDVFARPWRSFRQSRSYRLVDVWRTEATHGTTPIAARVPGVARFAADAKRILIGIVGPWEWRERVKLFSSDGVELAGYATAPGEEKAGIADVAFSADERHVAATLMSKIVRWTIEGERVGEHSLEDARDGAISREGGLAVLSRPFGVDPIIELVDLETMRPIARAAAPPGHHGIALSRDARCVVTSTERGVHCVPFDAAGPRWSSPTNGGTRSVVISDDGAFVVACHSPLSHPGREVVVHRVQDGDVVARFASERVDRARLLLDGRLLVWPQGGGPGLIYDLTGTAAPRTAAWVADVVGVSRDGSILAKTSFNFWGALLHDTRDGTTRVGPPRFPAVVDLAVSRDGARIALLNRNATVHDATSGAEVARIADAARPATWSLDGSCLVHAEQIPSEPTRLVVSSPAGHRLAAVQIPEAYGAVSMAMRPDGRLVVLERAGLTLRTPPRLAPPDLVFPLPANASLQYWTLALSPSGRRCLLENGLGESFFVDLEARRMILHLPAKSDSPRHTRLYRMLDETTAVFATPNTLVAFDLESESVLWELAFSAFDLVVESSRSRLIAVSPHRICILASATGEELDCIDLESSPDGITCAALGPEGRLYIGSELGRVYVFAPADSDSRLDRGSQ